MNIENTTMEYDHATIKVWFTGSNMSKNFVNIMSIKHVGNIIKLYSFDQQIFKINWDNVTLIEVINP
jgi:hypothetical protein